MQDELHSSNAQWQRTMAAQHNGSSATRTRPVTMALAERFRRTTPAVRRSSPATRMAGGPIICTETFSSSARALAETLNPRDTVNVTGRSEAYGQSVRTTRSKAPQVCRALRANQFTPCVPASLRRCAPAPRYRLFSLSPSTKSNATR